MENYCSRDTLYEMGTKDGLSSDIMRSVKLWRHTGPGGLGRQKTLTNEMTVVDLVISGTHINVPSLRGSESITSKSV